MTATPAIAAIGNVQGQGQGQGQVLPASCLTDPQAQSIVSAFSNMVTNKDRSSIGGVADGVLAGEFLGMSGSWNSVLGKPVCFFLVPNLGGCECADLKQASDITSGSKDAYVQAMQGRNAVPMMTDLDVFHDCNNIVWYWAASGVGSGQNEVRGMTLLYTVPSAGGSGGVVGGVVNTVNGVLGGNGRTPDMSVDRYGGRRVNMVMEEFNNLAWMEDEGRNLC